MKNWSAFIVSLLMSFGIWLILNLSRSNSDVESVPVLAVSNIDGRSSTAASPVTISARCKASGFLLMSLKSVSEPVRVVFSPADLVHKSGDDYVIPSEALYRYVPDIFGPGVSVESFLGSEVLVQFNTEHCRKIPVLPVKYLAFKPQYIQVSPLSTEPDSVLVYGAPDLINGIDYIQTKAITIKDIEHDEKGIVGLVAPSGVRLGVREVEYSLSVCRFVELSTDLKVNVKNAPTGSSVVIFPSKVSAVFRCRFPLRSDPRNEANCFIDYHKFSGSMSGRVVPEVDGLNDGVLNVKIVPDVVECVETR